MRESPHPRSRKSSLTGLPPPSSFSSGPTTFFLASEHDVDRAMASDPSSIAPSQTSSPGKSDTKISSRGSTYGVQSLDDALGEAFGDKSEDDAADKDREGGDGDMLYRLLRMRKKGPPLPAKAGSSAASNVANEPSEERIGREPPSAINMAPNDTTRSNSPVQYQHRRTSHTTISQPLTPLMLESPMPFGSACPSTPKSGSLRSLRLSEDVDGLTDDGASQAIASSDEEEDEPPSSSTIHKSGTMSSSAPELVMPSLAMPSRRPFTARGRQMGRLKVCVAGMKGVGKSSLIRAIVQHCEDIVHIDPPTKTAPVRPSPPSSKTRARSRRSRESGTTQITELMASTRAYPAWWSDAEESRILRRRKSMEDTVLDRNFCFIDTPGYLSSASDGQDVTVRYIEALLQRNASISAMSDNEILSVLAGNGGVQVDLVLFLFSSDASISEQAQRFRELASLTNAIPVLGKTDLLEPSIVLDLKVSILTELQSAGAKPFLFGKTIQGALEALSLSCTDDPPSTPLPDGPPTGHLDSTVTGTPQPLRTQTSNMALAPFAISTLPGSDDAEMDASLLMSPSYIPPPLPSELELLISQIFDPENIAWFRHSAARKFLAWRDRRRTSEGINGGGDSMLMHGGAMTVHKPSGPLTQGPLIARPPQNTSGISPFNMSSAATLGSGISDFTRARLRDHTLREETLAQMQLTRWAQELQRAMQHERDQYEALVNGERAKWLLERINEEVRTGNIGSIDTEGIMQRLPVLDASENSTSSKKSSRNSSTWALTKASSRKSSKRGRVAELPSWSRPKSAKAKNPLDPQDPLGLCDLGDNVRRGTHTLMKVIGGSVVVTVAYFAVIGAIQRLNGTGGVESIGEPFWMPRRLGEMIGRAVCPEEPQMWV